MKEFKEMDSNKIFLTQDNIYISKRRKKEDCSKMEAGEDVPGYITIKIKDIKEVWSKNGSNHITIILKTGKKKKIELFTLEIKDEFMEEFCKLPKYDFKKTEKLYTMKERVITPIIYIILALFTSVGLVWLTKEQPTIERNGFISIKEALVRKLFVFMEGMGVRNAIILGITIIIISLLYMVLRVVKPPIKLVLESEL